MKKYQKGFTLVELAIVFIVLSFVCGLGYVAIHFINKFW